ncbi:hypothetical protein C8R46DRAFT_1195109 [Mycena filopes]|nr:hypothetical protein C8R46DRAFT_1195109 [Mycena filopes]
MDNFPDSDGKSISWPRPSKGTANSSHLIRLFCSRPGTQSTSAMTSRAAPHVTRLDIRVVKSPPAACGTFTLVAPFDDGTAENAIPSASRNDGLNTVRTSVGSLCPSDSSQCEAVAQEKSKLASDRLPPRQRPTKIGVRPPSVMSSTSSDEDVSFGNAAKTLSLGKRKHTALDFHHGSEDTFPSSDLRALRPLPRRGRSRKTAAPLEGLTDATATAVAQERVRSPIEIELIQDGESGAARSEGEGPVLDKTVVSRDDSNSATAPGSAPLPRRATRPGAVYAQLQKFCIPHHETKTPLRRPRRFYPADTVAVTHRACITAHCSVASKLLVGKLCNACYEYERTYSKCRPPELVQRMQARDQSIVVKCVNCQTNVTYGTWYNSVLKPGSEICTGIYSLAHGFSRPLSKDVIKKHRARALREERLRDPYGVSNAPSTTVSPPRQCSNSLTKTTRDWVRSRLTLDWIYESKYGRHRPLSLEIKRSLKLVKQRELKKTLE